MSELTAFIQTTGFPVVACIIMYFQSAKSTEAIHKLELVITKLIGVLNKDEVLNDE